MNRAFVMIKNSANNETTKRFITNYFIAYGITILEAKITPGYEIEDKIDRHYGKIASKFNKNDVSEEGKKRFEEYFQREWDAAVIVTSPNNYPESAWRLLEQDKKTLKLEDGCVVGKLPDGTFIVNGFYPSMKMQYLCLDSLPMYCVEFNMSYEEFKEKIIGATDPTKAHECSIRGTLYRLWETCGIRRQPSIGENGIHGSGSEEDAKKEIELWFKI
jgi:nucleoside diphosphate kinase